VTRSLEEIIAAVNPEAMRAALVQKRSNCETELAAMAAAYRMESDNPLLKGAERKAELAKYAALIRKWQWAIDYIDARLGEADRALSGPPNRDGRRRRAKEG